MKPPLRTHRRTRTVRGLRSPTVRAAGLVLGAATIVLLILGSGCTSVAVPGNLARGDKTLRVFLTAESTSKAVLALDPNLTKTDRVSLNADLTSGATNSLNGLQKGAGTTYEFPMSAPLPQAYYLNLSKSIRGEIFWTSRASEARNEAVLDEAVIRAELFSGDRRVGGGENARTFVNDYDKSNTFQRLYLYFRPEVAVLNEGESLTLRLTRFEGLADFAIGTGTTHHSALEIHYYDFDPLAGAVYLEGGRLVVDPEAGGGSPSPAFMDRVVSFRQAGAFDHGAQTIYVHRDGSVDSTDALPALAAVGFAPVLALVLARWRPDRGHREAAGLALILLAAALAGCLGGTKGGQAVKTDEDFADAQYEEDPSLGGRGAIVGIVRDAETKFGVPTASLSFLGTNLFTRTDAKGRFALDNLTARDYEVRIQATGYDSLEERFQVFPGKRSKLIVNLTKSVGANEKPHQHDLYLDSDTYVVAEDITVTPASTQAGLCLFHEACAGTVKFPLGKTIPSGTGTVEITLDWDTKASDAPKEAMITVQTAANKTVSPYVARAPKDPFRVAIFPNEADPGHATFSTWLITVQVHATANAFHPLLRPTAQSLPPIHVRIVAHKSVLPYEPPHRDFWGGKGQLLILDDLVGTTLTAAAYPNQAASWHAAEGGFVPTGTKEIRGTLRWQSSRVEVTTGLGFDTGFNPVPWKLLYRAGNVPPAEWETHLSPVKESRRGEYSLDFVITPKAEECDPFYQKASNWQFFLDDDDAGTAGHGRGDLAYEERVYLQATAYRDPEYQG